MINSSGSTLADTPFRRMAQDYWKAGWTNPIPLIEKWPPPEGFTGYGGRSVSWADLTAWLEDSHTPHNIGIRLQGGLIGIDVDDYDDKTGAASFDAACQTLGDLPPTPTSTSRGTMQPSRIYFFKIPMDVSMQGAQRRFAKAFGQHVDIIHRGHRYAVVAPSVHPVTKAIYAWYRPSGEVYHPGEVPPLAEVPDLPAAWLEFLRAQPDDPEVSSASTHSQGGAPREFTVGEAERFMQTQAIEPLRSAKVGEINTTLNNSALVMSHFIPDFITYEAAAQRLRLALGETAADDKTKMRDEGTIRSGLSAEGGWKATVREVEEQEATSGSDDPEVSAHDFFTDEQMSRAFTREVLHKRYLFSRGLGWQQWDGQRWRDMSEEALLTLVGKWIVRRVQQAVKKDSTLGAAAMRQEGKTMKTLVECWKPFMKLDRQKAIITLSKGRVLVEPSSFDSDPDILNTPSGIVDLRTGELVPADPTRMCRKMTGAAYVPGFAHKDWDAALESVPEDSRAWLQAYLGQAITGYTPSEDTLLVLWGGGSNGKTLVMSGGVREALGDYYAVVDDAVLMGDRSGGATPEMMELFGARLAVLEETQEARRLDTQRLKKIVGTPVLQARHLYREPVTWNASHSLVINTNYLPMVKETDHGTWRRLLTMPFPYKFVNGADEVTEENHRVGDRGLKERLRSDPLAGSAVLTWLIDGARAWYSAGRVMPAAPERVQAATDAWRTRNDLVMGFLAYGAVEPDPESHVLSVDLLAALNTWLDSQGAHHWTDRLMSDRFEEHDAIKSKRVVRKRIRPNQSSAGRMSRPERGIAPAPTGQYTAWLGLRFVPTKTEEP